MSNPEEYLIPNYIFNEIGTFFGSDGSLNYQKYKKNVSNKFKIWLEANPQLNNLPLLSYIFRNNLKIFSFPICPTCGKALGPERVVKRAIYCCDKCSRNPEEVKKQRKKAAQTSFERFGVANYTKTTEYKEKRIKTCRERYGYDHPSQSPEVRQKAINTNNIKYGVPYAMQNSEIRKKSEETLEAHFGARHALQSPIFKEKAKQTWEKKYGVPHPFTKGCIVREKALATLNQRFGSPCCLQNKDVREKVIITRKMKYFETFLDLLKQKRIECLSSCEEYAACGVLKFRCSICGTEWESNDAASQHIKCPSCSRMPYSIKEKLLADYIRLIYDGPIQTNVRYLLGRKDQRELDIYLPEKHIAFEFDGYFWHSTMFKDENFHQNKTLDFKQKGIKVVHIYEFEWDKDQEKIKKIIKPILGIFDHEINSNECICREISDSEYSTFLEKYHLLGKDNASLKIGLFYRDALISVSGFKQGNKKIELSRYCIDPRYKIDKGLERMIGYTDIEHFITYVDFDHFDEIEFANAGFVLNNITPPNRIYIKNSNVIFSPEQNEIENLLTDGWLEVCNAGCLEMEYDRVRE